MECVRWARTRCTSPVQLDLAARIPELLRITQTNVLDNKALGLMCNEDLSRFEGWTLVIDLGYYGHKMFEQLLEWDMDIHFLSKIHPQAVYQVTGHRESNSKARLDSRGGRRRCYRTRSSPLAVPTTAEGQCCPR